MDLKTINGRRTILKYEEGGLNTALSDAIRKGISLDDANIEWAKLEGLSSTGETLSNKPLRCEI